jgi:hypothetical protein
VCLSVALFLTAAALISVGTVVISSDWVRRGRGWPELRILPRLALHAAAMHALCSQAIAINRALHGQRCVGF